MKKYIFLCQLLIIVSFPCKAQTVKWVTNGGAKGDSTTGGYIYTDNDGNAYLSGTFTNSAVIGDDTMYTQSTQYSSAYIASYTANGNFRWAIGANTDGECGFSYQNSLATDAFGNVWVPVYFRNATYITIGNFTVKQSSGLFLLECDRNGKARKIVQFSPSVGIASISSGANSEVYINGYFYNEDSVSFAGIAIRKGPLPNNYFIAGLDSSGNGVFARNVVSSNNSVLYGYDSVQSGHNGNLYQEITYNTTFHSLNRNDSLSINGLWYYYNPSLIQGSNSVLIKYYPNGQAAWAKLLGYSSSAGAMMCVGYHGDIYFADNTDSAVKIDGVTIQPDKQTHSFLAKLDSSGRLVWAKPRRLTQYYATLLASDGDDNLYFTEYDSLICYRPGGSEKWGMVAPVGAITGGASGNLFFSSAFDTSFSFGRFHIPAVGRMDMVTGMIENIDTIASVSGNQGPDLDFYIYPNPASSKVSINLTDAQPVNYKIYITDVEGKVIFSSTATAHAGGNTFNLEVNNFTSGMYFLYLQNENFSACRKFMKD